MLRETFETNIHALNLFHVKHV